MQMIEFRYNARSHVFKIREASTRGFIFYGISGLCFRTKLMKAYVYFILISMLYLFRGSYSYSATFQATSILPT